jgi:undecaprenyl-diphosphatase
VAATTGETDAIERSPADVLRLGVAAVALLVVVLVEWLFGDTLVTFFAELLAGLEALPTRIVSVVVLGTRILAVVVLGGGLVWTLRQGRWRMLGTVAVAGIVAGVMAGVFSGAGPDADQSVLDVHHDLGPLSHSEFPTAAGLAGATAALTAAAPWLSRRWRRAGAVLIVGLIVTRSLTAPVSFATLHAALLGWLVGAAVLVALGAPSRRPTRSSVVAGLTAVGLPLRHLEAASVDARGSTPYFGTAVDGTSLFVKALGDDERSADLMFRCYRRLVPRNFGDERPFSSLRRGVEHEALVALAARDLGVRTPRLVAFATAEPHGCVLAYEAIEGTSLDRVEAAGVTDAVLAEIWQLVGALRQHRIAHRDLRLANIFLDESGEVWLIDFGFSELAASDLLLATDVAELLASSAVYVGAERAVAAAAAVLDPAALAPALDRLRRWALSGATRTAHKQRPSLLGDLRTHVTDAMASGR